MNRHAREALDAETGPGGEARIPFRESAAAGLGFVAILLLVYASILGPGATLVYSSNWNPLDFRPLEQNYGPGFRTPDVWHSRNLNMFPNFHDAGAAWWQWEPGAAFLRRSLLDGDLPLWDPYSGAGTPAMANVTSTFFFPPYFLAVLLGNTVALKDLYFLSLLWMAGQFTYLLLRRHGLSAPAAFFAGTAYMASGALNQNVGSLVGQAAACLPVALYVSRRFLDRPTWQRTGVLALVYAGLSLASFPPVMVATFGLTAAYVLTHLCSQWRSEPAGSTLRATARYAAGVVGSLGLVGFYYLPALALIASLPHVRAVYEGAGLQDAPLAALLDLLSPTLTDGHKVLAYPPVVQPYEPVLFYLGPVPLLLALFASRRGGGRRGPLAAFLGWAAALVALKLVGGVPSQWIAHLPVLESVHFAQYFSIPLDFLLAALGGVGVESLVRKRPSLQRLAAAAAAALAVLFAVRELALAAGALTHPAAFSWIEPWRGVCALAASTGGLVVLLALPPIRRALGTHRLAWGLTVVLALQAFAFNHYPRQQDWDVWRNPPPYVDRLAAASDYRRVYTIGALPANSGSAFQIFALDSIYAFNPTRTFEYYRRYFSTGREQFMRGATLLPSESVLDAAAIGLLAIRVEMADLLEQATARGYEVAYSDDYVRVLERPSAPRFFFTSDYLTVAPADALATLAAARPPRRVILEEAPGFEAATGDGTEGAVRLLGFERNEYALEVRARVPGLLYAADSHFAGWTAEVDGVPAPILPANHAFRAVPVPAGRSVVRFRYWPPGLTVGLVLTALSLAGVGAMLWGRVGGVGRVTGEGRPGTARPSPSGPRADTASPAPGALPDVVSRRFVSFDGTETMSGGLARPDRYRHLFDVLSRTGPSIPRGAGLSYCCASAGEGVVSVSSSRFDRVLAFDRETGSITVEPGVPVGALHDLAVASGWYPATLPGHPRITVGGCVGFDVHGKSGACFRSSIRSLTLFHPAFGEVECSAEREPELFELTIGGFGLTGFVTSVTLRLLPLPGASLERDRTGVQNLYEAVEVMTERAGGETYVYSWNDLTRRGRSFGRGVVYSESFAPTPRTLSASEADLSAESRRSLRLPWLNELTIGGVNRLYDTAERLRGSSVHDLKSGSFPMLDRSIYFKLLGSRGFREYQMLVPAAVFPSVAGELEAAIHDTRSRCSLGSLKLLDSPPGMLRFSGQGVAVVLDVPAGDSAERLFSRLDEVAVRYGALANVSKDSRLPARVVAELFPGYDAFRAGIRALGGRFDSALGRRLLG